METHFSLTRRQGEDGVLECCGARGVYMYVCRQVHTRKHQFPYFDGDIALFVQKICCLRGTKKGDPLGRRGSEFCVASLQGEFLTFRLVFLFFVPKFEAEHPDDFGRGNRSVSECS